MKPKDPRATAWVRAQKHYDLVVTVARLRRSKGERDLGLFLQSWESKKRGLYPRVSSFIDAKGKASERKLGQMVLGMLEYLELLRQNPKFDVAEGKQAPKGTKAKRAK